MSTFSYIAFDAHGQQTKGTLAVDGQLEAVARLKEMGFFPTRIVESKDVRHPPKRGIARADLRGKAVAIGRSLWGKSVGAKQLTLFTRQIATLLEAGMPLLRGLRLLHEQEESVALKRVIESLAASIEGGSTFSEALALHPKVFNTLYVNMVKAGEIGGVLEVVLKRLADFMEKIQKIKGKVASASFYPIAVLVVAVSIMGLLMTLVVPKFKEVFDGLMNGRPLPAFTQFMLQISEAVKSHVVLVLCMTAGLAVAVHYFCKTRFGRQVIDRLKLRLPIFGSVFRKFAVARFTRTLGTLAASGVPILQALTIVKETAGNVVVRDAVGAVHESVKQGETIAAPLRQSTVFPAMVVGMVDIGEQTGALPDMLMKIADIYEDEVDNAVSAMTSLLEPVLIVFLAVVVGSIVIALFLPLVTIMTDGFEPPARNET
jgi:type IV pilus assembly protein PilC